MCFGFKTYLRRLTDGTITPLKRVEFLNLLSFAGSKRSGKREFPLALSFKDKHVICKKGLPQTSFLSIALLRDMLQEVFPITFQQFSFLNCKKRRRAGKQGCATKSLTGVVTCSCTQNRFYFEGANKKQALRAGYFTVT
jgi:hypothetical protein